MNAAAPLSKEPVSALSIHALARQHLAAANGETRIAAATMREAIMSDRALLDAILDGLIKEACSSAASAAHIAERAKVIRIATTTPEQRKAQAEALGRVQAAMLLDFPLAGGKKLRDADREAVAATVTIYEKAATANSVRALWLRLIAQTLEPGVVVGQALTEERAVELYKSAEREIGGGAK